MLLSQYQHQSTPVPSTGNVCPALWCRNMDPLGCRHEDTGGFSHEVSATDTWYTLVGSCIQCRGASAIWFVSHWWHLASSRLISGHVARLDPGVPAHDDLRLMVDTYEGRKPMASWRRPPDRPRMQRLAQQGPGGCQHPTGIYAVEIWDRQGSRSGATVHSDYATMIMMIT